MVTLKQFSLPIATLGAVLTVGAMHATAEAAIISGQVSGTWDYDSYYYWGYEPSEFKTGDTFTAIYTYDSDSITTNNYSNTYYYDTYYESTVPLLSLILNSGTGSYTFDPSFSNGNGYGYLQWLDVDYNNAYYGHQGTQKGTYLHASSYTGAESNYFYAQNYSGTDYSGNPYAYNYAYAYAYDYNTGKYLGYSYTNQPVFSSVVDPLPTPTPNPTSVPEPSILLGLIGLGLGALGQRKAQGQATSAEQSV